MNTITDFTTHLAKQAGDCLLSYFDTRNIKINLKLDQSVVTDADMASNKLIVDSIRNHYPEDGILSEEGDTVYPPDHPYVWIIDPLDGTTNFSLGLHYWGVSITRLFNGEPDIAVNYFPILSELYLASKGNRATLNGTKLNGNQIRKANPRPFFSCCSRTHKRYYVDIKYKTRILGSATYGLSSVAKGTAIVAFEVTPKIWDFSACWLIVQESEGIISPYGGEKIFPLRPGTDYSKISYPILAAISQKEWKAAREQISPKNNISRTADNHW
jgi:myo-inositol-1(or 4)-monophosphatase